MRRLTLAVLAVLSMSLMAGCPYVAPVTVTEAQFETSLGTFIVELDTTSAPVTAANFVAYAEDGFYDDTIFHRVLAGFVVQGGGFTEDLTAKVTRDPITNEASNGLTNARGAIAMARTGDPDSATAQFFINVANNVELDPQPGQAGYAVFGHVVSGMEVVDLIANTPTAESGGFFDLPATPVTIDRIEIIERAEEGVELTAEGEEYVETVQSRATDLARNTLAQILSAIFSSL